MLQKNLRLTLDRNMQDDMHHNKKVAIAILDVTSVHSGLEYSQKPPQNLFFEVLLSFPL